jgi:peptidoglycan-N-acetylmuramic acid deacetylase
MTNRLKTWLLTGGVVLALSAGAVLSGFAIAKMTRKDTPDDTTKEATNEPGPSESAVQDRTTEAYVDPSTAPTVPTDPTAPVPPVDSGGIRELTAAELNDIRGQYASVQKNYYAGGAADQDGRPISCTKFNEAFSELFGNGVHIYQRDTSSTALTFILVNEYGHTNTALDNLSNQGVMATFFVNRNYAEKNPGIIRRIIDEGHTLGSLGATFPDAGFSSLSLEDQMESALSLQRYIKELYQYDMKLFNYVHDDYTEQSLALITKMGYQVVFYSVKYADYDPNASINTDEFLETMKKWAHPGAVYNFHTTNPASLSVVPQLVSYLKDNGYQVGPLN